jgi:hypothetical protein
MQKKHKNVLLNCPKIEIIWDAKQVVNSKTYDLKMGTSMGSAQQSPAVYCSDRLTGRQPREDQTAFHWL